MICITLIDIVVTCFAGFRPPKASGSNQMVNKVLIISILTLSVGLLAMPAMADGVTIQNPSFETVNMSGLTSTCAGPGTCAFNFGPIPGWTITGVGGSFEPSSTFLNLPLPQGNIVAFSNGGTISQTLTSSLLADTTYTLSVFIGNRLDGLNSTYTIALDAGSTQLCFFSGSSATVAPKGGFADETCTFNSGSAFPTGLLSIILSAGGPQVDFDNVSLTASPVSEASSAALTGSGLLLILFAAAYFKRKQFSLELENTRSTIA